MAPFSQLTDSEIWNLAFYVEALRYEGKKESDPGSGQEKFLEKIPLKTLASSSDAALRSQLSGTAEEQKKALSYLRLFDGERPGPSLATTRIYLKESLQKYESGEKEEAKQKALLAYLEGIEPLEPRLRTLDPSLTVELEGQMASFRGLIEKGASLEELQKALPQLNSPFDKVEDLLRQTNPSLGFIFLMALTIIFGKVLRPF